MNISAGHLGFVVSVGLMLVLGSGCAAAPQAKTPSEVISATHAELAHTVEPAAVEEWRSVSVLLADPLFDSKVMDSTNPYAVSLDAPSKEELIPVRTWGNAMPAKVIQPALPTMLDNRE
jgi:hypothetical protein